MASAPGSTMAFAAMCSVQLGAAASVALADRLGPAGVVWLRLACAAVILVVVARPWRVPFTRAALRTCLALGVTTAGMTLMFMAAAVRLPLGTASALEFLGPLTVALVRGSATVRLWALVAAAGVLGLTEPWRGDTDFAGVALALGAAACWGGYIVLTQRAGGEVTGLRALAVSIPVAAFVVMLTVPSSAFAALDAKLLVTGVGLALLMPAIPFALELLALRRLTAAVFGVIMSLEPAIALVVGFAVLGQSPRPAALAGIALVVAAGIGAQRTGARVVAPDVA
ncbi:MAG TPA: EamA family transporter [Solirubrobacteraceae bacterium]|nr:EamA family transporter [Solirubrobacteraceae bacterium]